MPIYEYLCQKCKKVFEKLQKINEDGKSLKCPSCGEETPEKILSGFSSSKGTEGPPSCGQPSGRSRFS